MASLSNYPPGVDGTEPQITGEPDALAMAEQLAEDGYIKPVELRAMRYLHTIENHEKSYRAMFGKDCDDPDCEFHHPEVLED
jgi:hypothetical protein